MRWVLALALLAFAAPAHAAPVQLKVTQRGESTFRVPRGVTQLQATAVGERGKAGRGAEVAATLPVHPGDVLTLRVGMFGDTPDGGGLSGVFASSPLLVAAGGGRVGDARGGANGGALNGAGGGGAGYPGGVDGQGGVSFPGAGRLVDAPPSLMLEYDDADAPAISLNAPGAINPTEISGTAGIEGGDAQGVSLRFFAPGTPEPVAAVALGIAADGRFSAAVPLLPDGEWMAQAVQTDVAGHTGSSVPVALTFDRNGPRVRITSGALTNDPHAPISGTLGDAPGDRSEVMVTVSGPSVNATVPAAIDRNGFHAELPDALADGRYTAVARQVDEYGHVGTDTLAFAVDTLAPAIALDAPGAEVSTARVSGTADAGTVRIDLFGPSGVVASTSAPVVGGAFAAVLAPADGAYTARATLIDEAGNTGVASRAFRLDSTPPVIDTSGVRATYTRGEAPPRGFACSDAGVGVAACEGSLDTSALGEHVLNVTARDRLGNVATAAVRYVVVAAPVRKLTAALRITKVSRRGRTLTVKGTAARTATGTVSITVGGVRKPVKLVRGAWSATLRAKGKRVTAHYGGDGTHLAATVKR